MKHPFIILGTAGAILMLGGAVWVYLFIFYVPPPENARVAENPFVEVDAEQFGAIPEGGVAEGALSPTAVSAGVAITERRVVGVVALSGTYRVIEAGTGHAYEIAEGGVERKISNTTFPQAVDAKWAPSGEHVVITREADGALRTFIVTLGAGDVDDTSVELNDAAQNIAWSKDSNILKYTRAGNNGSEGIALNVETDAKTVLFTTPLREIAVQWDTDPLIMTKATREYTGYAYRSNLTLVTDPMSALSAIERGGLALFSGLSGNALASWFVRGDTTIASERSVIPEKCALIESGAVCASPKVFDATKYPDNWYRGEEVYDDEVVYIDAETGIAETIGDLAIAYRTPLDIVRATSVQGGALMQSRDGRVVFVPLTR